MQLLTLTSNIMPKSIHSPDLLPLLEEIIQRGREQGLSQGELAQRAGTTPETLSRMKRRGSADFGLVDRLARIVGHRLALVPDNDTLEAIRRGDFFE